MTIPEPDFEPGEVPITKENWQQAALLAIERLPEDIKCLVGHVADGNVLTLKIAGNPLDTESGEASISEVVVRWWDHQRDEEEWLKSVQETGDAYRLLYGPGGPQHETLDWPIVTIAGEFDQHALNAGRTSTQTLVLVLQNEILESMHSGGGWSTILKDKNGHFIREDGSRVVEWP